MSTTMQTTMFSEIDMGDWGKVKNCHVVYQPRGRAAEYARLACNPYRGCGHGCVYCYAPSAIFTSRDDFHDNPKPRKDILHKIERDARKYQAAHIHEPVLLCFTCDPYQPLDDRERLTRSTIEILHAHGLPVQILTKGGHRSLRDIDLLGEGDKYAATLTLLDDEESAIWEPNAAPPSERIDALRTMHDEGIETWVSLEPVLYPDVSQEIIRRTYPFVDMYKVGVLNYVGSLPASLRTQVEGVDWRTFGESAIALLETYGYEDVGESPGAPRRYYIKDDLRDHLVS